MSKKILLVEDDAFVRDLYQTVLTRAGYDIEVANDGEEAVSMADYKVYDLILLDIMLPKLTGMEVLKQLRTDTSRAKDTPIYLLTNLGEENIVKEAYRLGASGYLLKAKYLPKQLVDEVDKFFVKSPDGEENSKIKDSIESDAALSAKETASGTAIPLVGDNATSAPASEETEAQTETPAPAEE